jgi:hypothetical protein
MPVRIPADERLIASDKRSRSATNTRGNKYIVCAARERARQIKQLRREEEVRAYNAGRQARAQSKETMTASSSQTGQPTVPPTGPRVGSVLSLEQQDRRFSQREKCNIAIHSCLIDEKSSWSLAGMANSMKGRLTAEQKKHLSLACCVNLVDLMKDFESEGFSHHMRILVSASNSSSDTQAELGLYEAVVFSFFPPTEARMLHLCCCGAGKLDGILQSVGSFINVSVKDLFERSPFAASTLESFKGDCIELDWQYIRTGRSKRKKRTGAGPGADKPQSRAQPDNSSQPNKASSSSNRGVRKERARGAKSVKTKVSAGKDRNHNTVTDEEDADSSRARDIRSPRPPPPNAANGTEPQSPGDAGKVGKENPFEEGSRKQQRKVHVSLCEIN